MAELQARRKRDVVKRWFRPLLNRSRPITVCESPFCLLWHEFKWPNDGHLQDRFYEYLLDHGADKGIYLGTLTQLRSRTSCTFCQFALENIEVQARSPTSMVHDHTASFAIVENKRHLTICLETETVDYRWPAMSLGEGITLLDETKDPCPHSGRRVAYGDVDLGLVNHWIGLCTTLHSEVCSLSDELYSERQGTPTRLRVIDVSLNCLTDIAWREKYVALSYVWGGATQLKLCTAHLSQFYTPGHLLSQSKAIPRTIHDAMTFTQGIGLRYLWVDALCLIQDAGDDVMNAVMNMDMIYERAHVTVIAADGLSADSGISGIGKTPRKGEQSIKLLKPGLSIMRIHALDTYLNKSIWVTRGWTLQEQHLSRRTVIFVDNKIYFRCRQRVWSEETHRHRKPELQNMSEWTTSYVTLAQENMDLGEEGPGAAYDYLISAVQKFQQRYLSNDDDALKAMAGIAQRVAQNVGTTMLEGLPRDIFPLFICFQHYAGPNEPWVRPTRRARFPSWSWAGWDKPCDWESFRSLQVFGNTMDIDEAMRCTIARIETYGSLADDRMERETIYEPPTAIMESIMGSADIGVSVLSEMQRSSINKPRPHLLLAITSMVFEVRLRNFVTKPGPVIITEWNMQDTERQTCGRLALDADMVDDPSKLYTCLVISKAYKLDTAQDFRIETEETAPNYLWVLLIVETEGTVYERRGLGLFLQSRIDHTFGLGPQWKTILLG